MTMHRARRYAAPFVAIVLFQALLASVSLTIMSSVRAYVAGEGQWSKGQKDAIRSLSLYAMTGQESHFQDFRSAIAVPLADRAARLAMEQSPPDLAAAQTRFLGGNNHPNDVAGMIRLFIYFHDFPYMVDAVRDWRATDPYLDQLSMIGDALRDGFASRHPELPGNFEQISRLNAELSKRAVAFSDSLGSASRAIATILTAANLLVGGVLIVIILWYIGNVAKQSRAFANELEDQKERAQVTLASIGEAVISTDLHGQVDYMNPAAECLVGLPFHEARGAKLGTLFTLVDETTGECDPSLVEQLPFAAHHSRRHLLVRPDCRVAPVAIQSAPLFSHAGAAGGVVVLHDTTDERDLIDRLARLASHDALTGLPNRREFESRLQDALREGNVLTNHCVMILDLDQFKVVNDTCGHAAGDELLRQISTLLRETLGENGTLARLGGDEFGVLVKCCEASRAESLAEQLLVATRRAKFAWQGRAFGLGVSIGMALVAPGTPIDEALSAADVACYAAKQRGRDRVQVYTPGDSELSQRVHEMNWVQRIGSALDEDRFCLYAQEIRGLAADQSTFHVELLLRLRDENGAIVGPGSFIPAAERFDLMQQIDRWVVRAALAFCVQHLGRARPRRISSCSINLSGKSIGDEDFAAYVRQQIADFGVPPEMICFEITETSAIADLYAARRFIGSLKSLGCRFSLDDFGSGMSSFSYLRELPVDRIKIDGSFVREIARNEVDRAMVEMICRLGKIMGKTVVAEFAETDEIVRILREIGVDYAQGYAIGRPMPLEELDARRTGKSTALRELSLQAS